MLEGVPQGDTNPDEHRDANASSRIEVLALQPLEVPPGPETEALREVLFALRGVELPNTDIHDMSAEDARVYLNAVHQKAREVGITVTDEEVKVFLEALEVHLLAFIKAIESESKQGVESQALAKILPRDELKRLALILRTYRSSIMYE